MTPPANHRIEASKSTSPRLALILAGMSIPALFTLVVLLNAWGVWPRWGETERRTLRFGEGPSLGELRLIQDGNCFTCYYEETSAGDAVGTVKVKVPDSRWHLSLIVSDEAIPHLKQLQQLRSRDLEVIDLAQSPVTDSDLLSLHHFHLEVLDLSGTGIHGSGLQWLHFSEEKKTQIRLQGAQNLSQEALIALGDRPGNFSLDISGSNLDQPEILNKIRQTWCPDVEPQSCPKQIK